jgi:hypothetical protein
LFVIASEAKQSILSLRGEMDCFASLAMTVVRRSASYTKERRLRSADGGMLKMCR